MDLDTQSAICVVPALAFEPSARLEQVHRKAVELCWLHVAGFGDVDRAVFAASDLAHGRGLAAKGQADAELFDLHVLAIEVDDQGFTFNRDGHGFHVSLRQLGLRFCRCGLHRFAFLM